MGDTTKNTSNMVNFHFRVNLISFIYYSMLHHHISHVFSYKRVPTMIISMLIVAKHHLVSFKPALIVYYFTFTYETCVCFDIVIHFMRQILSNDNILAYYY